MFQNSGLLSLSWQEGSPPEWKVSNFEKKKNQIVGVNDTEIKYYTTNMGLGWVKV